MNLCIPLYPYCKHRFPRERELIHARFAPMGPRIAGCGLCHGCSSPGSCSAFGRQRVSDVDDGSTLNANTAKVVAISCRADVSLVSMTAYPPYSPKRTTNW